MRKDTIDHVAITVADLDSAVNWYLTSFSCELEYRDKQQAVLRFANIKLSLVLPSFQQNHIAFIRSDADTLGELREQADGTVSTFIADASGNLIEVVDGNSSTRDGIPPCE